MAAQYNRTISRGDDFNFIVIWKDETGTAIDNTSYSAVLELRKDKAQTTADLTLSSPTTITLGGSNGKFTCAFSDTNTTALSGRYFYKLKATSSGAITTTIITGAFNFE